MDVTPRFLTVSDVAEVLNTSQSQVYLLLRRGELRAIKLGGRGQWRIEASALEELIAAGYAAAQRSIDEDADAGPEDLADMFAALSALPDESDPSER